MKLFIEVDTNDGDLVGELTTIHEPLISELKDTLNKLLTAGLTNGYGLRIGCGEVGEVPDRFREVLTDVEINNLLDMCPHPEFGFHSIDTIILVEEIETLL